MLISIIKIIVFLLKISLSLNLIFTPHMKLDDVIEFFGFSPDHLLQEIEDTAITHFQHDKPALDNFILNFTIFKEYVSTHCFSFPQNFSFERKVNDTKEEINLQKSIDEIKQIRDEIHYFHAEKIRLENEKALNSYKFKKYKKLIQDMQIIKSHEELRNSMNKRVDALNEVYRKISESGVDQNGSGIGMLMDNDGFRKEMENKERGDLIEMYDVGVIDDLIQCHGRK